MKLQSLDPQTRVLLTLARITPRELRQERGNRISRKRDRVTRDRGQVRKDA